MRYNRELEGKVETGAEIDRDGKVNQKRFMDLSGDICRQSVCIYRARVW